MSTFLDAHAHTRIDSPETGVLLRRVTSSKLLLETTSKNKFYGRRRATLTSNEFLLEK